MLKYQYASGPPITMLKNTITPVGYVVRRCDAQDMYELYRNAKRPALTCGALASVVENCVLAASYSPLSSTIASTGLNCRVRNENGCDPSDKPPERNFQRTAVETKSDKKVRKQYATPTIPVESSVGGLVHLGYTHYCASSWCLSTWSSPTSLITIPHLRVGFPLRCFQRLSVPDIATGRCTWWYSPQTRGQFIEVLSYYQRISSRINACSRLRPTCLTTV